MSGIADGDTIHLRSLGTVRLIGVDTPEVYGAAECYGREASRFTKHTLTLGMPVKYRLGVEQRDRYGRALAYVWLPDGRMFNGLLALRGYAVPLTIQPNSDYAELFVAAARKARRAQEGLWSPRTCAGDADLPAADEGHPPAKRPPPPGDRDCSDFHTQAGAQRYFDSKGGRPGNNVDNLDANGDGRVCESLP
ncbi:MAG: thermonuclease family protein [Thermoleophilaceae bacterium]